MVRLSRRAVIFGGPALSVATAIGPARTHAGNGARPALPISAELRANAEGAIALDAQPGSMRFQGGLETATYGINGPYLGPALRLRRGQRVVVKVQNGVPQPITMHWHGLIIPGADDGGPHQGILPGNSWSAELSIDQPAATLWFHPHIYPTTADLVIKGLAGLLIIDDDEADRLPLPSRWGIDDLPLIIQDRRFTAGGQFFERFNIVAVTNGYMATRCW
jgi:blue copper oxidase